MLCQTLNTQQSKVKDHGRPAGCVTSRLRNWRKSGQSHHRCGRRSSSHCSLPHFWALHYLNGLFTSMLPPVCQKRRVKHTGIGKSKASVTDWYTWKLSPPSPNNIRSAEAFLFPNYKSANATEDILNFLLSEKSSMTSKTDLIQSALMWKTSASSSWHSAFQCQLQTCSLP